MMFKSWIPLPMNSPSPKFLGAINDSLPFPSLLRQGVTCFLGGNAGAFEEVNAWVNQAIQYTNDPTDDWQKPSDTLTLGTGDCEDYCLLKRALLIERGFTDAELMMVVGFDLDVRQEHAVLLGQYDNDWWVMDNRTASVMRSNSFEDFHPTKGYKALDSYIFGVTK